MIRLVTVIMFLVFSSSVTYAQYQCFSNATNMDAFVASLNNGADCALGVSGQGCIGITSEETQNSIHPGGGIPIDFCDLWCEDEGPSSFNVFYQANVFNDALALAVANAPTCAETGETMVVVGMEFYADLLVCGGCPGFFLAADVTYACCKPADDCNASFDIYQDSDDCQIYLSNTSTPSTINDCGDCENPSGITSVHWSVAEYFDGNPIGYVSPYTGSQNFHFDFDPSGAGQNDGFQICLTIEDCLGCTSTHCEILNDFVPCRRASVTDGEGTTRAPGKLTKLDPSEKEVIVYPNPSQDFVNLQLSSKASLAGSTLEIYSLQGQLIRTSNRLQEGTNTILVGDLASGIYLFTVNKQGERIHTEKVIIED